MPRAVVPIVRMIKPFLSKKIFVVVFPTEDNYNTNIIISKINNFNDIHKKVC